MRAGPPPHAEMPRSAEFSPQDRAHAELARIPLTRLPCRVRHDKKERAGRQRYFSVSDFSVLYSLARAELRTVSLSVCVKTRPCHDERADNEIGHCASFVLAGGRAL